MDYSELEKAGARWHRRLLEHLRRTQGQPVSRALLAEELELQREYQADWQEERDGDWTR